MEHPRKRLMIVDCQLSGASGDMIIGALLGAGASESKVKDAIESIPNHVDWCKEISAKIKDIMKGEFRAKQVDIEIKESATEEGRGRPASQILNAVIRASDGLELSDQARGFASRVADTLVKAERKIHGESEDTELHELGSADTVADIIGVAAALDDMKIFTEALVSCTPVSVGGGLYKFSHGILASPGPVTLEILRMFSFPMIGGPVEAELLTPTGASLIVNMANGRVNKFYSDVRPVAVGYGAGKMDLGEVANLLRIILGETFGVEPLTDRIAVLETNLDDVDGELMGYLVDRLLDEGAKDVSVIPVIMKKSRPGQILRVLVDETDAPRISEIIMEETGSLGVRSHIVKRYVVSRRVVPIQISVDGVKRVVRVKIARNKDGKMINIKPEYEDVKNISMELHRPFRYIERIAGQEATTRIETDGTLRDEE